MAEVLSSRQLNRATLDRQLLLQRSHRSPDDAVGHLVGLQAQNPLDPYLALWSRLTGFDPDSVGGMIEERALVRIVVMRGTIHLTTATDALSLRPLMQPVLDAELRRHPEFAPHLVGVDMGPNLAVARTMLIDRPMTGTQLRAALAGRFPDVHAGAMADACRCLLPLVQVPPRGVWGRSAAAPAAAHVPRRARPRTVRPTRRASSARRRPCTGSVPSRVRQRAAVARRPFAVRVSRWGLGSRQRSAHTRAVCWWTGASRRSGTSSRQLSLIVALWSSSTSSWTMPASTRSMPRRLR